MLRASLEEASGLHEPRHGVAPGSPTRRRPPTPARLPLRPRCAPGPAGRTHGSSRGAPASCQRPGLSPESVSNSGLASPPNLPSEPQKPLPQPPRPRARPAEPKPGRKRHLAAPARRPIVLGAGRGSSPAPPPPVGVQFMVVKSRGPGWRRGKDPENTSWGGCERVRAAGEKLRAALHPPRRVGRRAGTEGARGSERGFSLRGRGPYSEAAFLRTGGEGGRAQCPPKSLAPAFPPPPQLAPHDERIWRGGGVRSREAGPRHPLYGSVKSTSRSPERPRCPPRHRPAGRSSSER